MKQWYINAMNCKPKDGDLTDFVIEVRWTRNASELINDKEYYAWIYGTQSFSASDITNFIPYEQLTYDIVCGWLNDSIDVIALDASLDKEIENQVNPPIVNLPLPFNNPTI
jgi:hypothetical protein